MLKLRYVKSVRFFSRIRTEYEEIRSACPYSVRMRENADHKTPNTDTFYAVLKSRFPNEIIFNTFRTNIPSFQDFPRILESIEVTAWTYIGSKLFTISAVFPLWQGGLSN